MHLYIDISIYRYMCLLLILIKCNDIGYCYNINISTSQLCSKIIASLYPLTT